MDQIVGAFPVPLMFCQQAVPLELVAALIAQFEASEKAPNVRTTALSHTGMADPQGHPNYRRALGFLTPKVQAFGETLLGETLEWTIKEIWINRMETGGAQKMHNHANSFVSGILYLTASHPSAATVFYRQVGANSFLMANENRRSQVNPFNSPIFKAPAVAPGDVVLFPSYLTHEVPPNQGEPRMTAAFNALPHRIESWGYTVRFR